MLRTFSGLQPSMRELAMRPAVRLIATFFCFAFSIAVLSHAAQAQTETVLHNFSGGVDGQYPYSGVTLDQQGRLYGTTSAGGTHQQGLVYRAVREGGGWVLSPLYSFGSQQDDGNTPYARVVFGPGGVLYGTTYTGPAEYFGTVFSLQPPASACKTTLCPWVETVLYRFTGGADGRYPHFGDLVFDQAGNIYGTTTNGGGSGSENGVVFKLSRSGSGWTETTLWQFTGGSDGAHPLTGVILDNAGNVYGTTYSDGANGYGTVYELSPTQSGWTETTLYSFTENDGFGGGGLTIDASGNLYGITGYFVDELLQGNVVVYELSPQNGSWSYAVLYSFGLQNATPIAAPVFDAQGNLYGPLPYADEIFKLTRSGNQWNYSPYFTFNGGNNGADPFGTVAFDGNGNMYGTTILGGTGTECFEGGCGVVWKIAP